MILSASTVPRSKLIPVSISYCNTWFLTRFYNLTLQQSTAISTAIYVAILHIFLLSFSGFQGFLHRLYLQIIYLLGWAANKLSLGRSSLNMRHIPRSALNMLRVPRSSLDMRHVPRSALDMRHVPRSSLDIPHVPRSSLDMPHVPRSSLDMLHVPRSSLDMLRVPRSSLNMLRVPRSSLNMPPHPSLPTHSPFSLGFGLCKMWVSVGRYE